MSGYLFFHRLGIEITSNFFWGWLKPCTSCIGGRKFNIIWVSLLLNTSFHTVMQSHFDLWKVRLNMVMNPSLSFWKVCHILQILISWTWFLAFIFDETFVYLVSSLYILTRYEWFRMAAPAHFFDNGSISYSWVWFMIHLLKTTCIF